MDTGARHRALLGCRGDLLDSWEAGGLGEGGVGRVMSGELRGRSAKNEMNVFE